MAKMKITKRTYDRNVMRFARISSECFKKITDFVDRRCRSEKERKEFMDELIREVVDSYINLNNMICSWCTRNGVDVCDFIRDVGNTNLDACTKGGASRKEK